MSVLIEVNHPGQVHLLKHVYHNLKNDKRNIQVITKKNKTINHLLDINNIPYLILGEKGNGVTGKLFKQIQFDWKALKIKRKNNLEIGLGSSITNDHLSAISPGFNSIHLSDDDEEMVPLIAKFSYPFADVILAPDCLYFPKFQHKVISYKGYHELAYLHPNNFKPDPRILGKIGIKPGEKYFVLRFVALKGHHDSGHKGITKDQKHQIIAALDLHGRIFITSENPIEPEFEKYRLPVKPEEIHSLMYYAHLFIGDSQTMTTEAAILGTPALKCNTFAGKLSVPNELQAKYDLCYSYLPEDFTLFFEHINLLLNDENLKEKWSKKVEKMLVDKIDVSEFITWFVKEFPTSKNIMNSNPDFQLKFK